MNEQITDGNVAVVTDVLEAVDTQTESVESVTEPVIQVDEVVEKETTNAKKNGKREAKNNAQGDNKIRVEFENSPHKIHPEVAALQIPTQTSEEYEELREDIQRAGKIRDAVKKSRHPITKEVFIVDGWHRQHIADELNFTEGKQYKVEYVDYEDAVAVAVSASKRRNLNDNQRAAMAMRLLEVEREQANERQKANARTNNLIRGLKKPEIIEVEYERVAAKGDIGLSYSPDAIQVASKSANSKVRGSFEHEGVEYAAVDGMVGSRLICYKLATLQEFEAAGGQVTNYVTRSEEWAAGKNVDSYDGILVNLKQGDELVSRVLQGPPVVFAAAESDVEETKAKKKKGRASEKVAQQTGMSASTIERLDYVKKNDKEAFNRISKGENIPGTGLPETINSAYLRLKAKEKADAEANGNNGDTKEDVRNPDNYTPEEFIERHPLHEQVKDREDYAVFCDAVKAWIWMNQALRALKKAGTSCGLLGRNPRPKDDMTRYVIPACSIPHPYDWEYKEDAEGGYTMKRTPKLPKPKAEPKVTEPEEVKTQIEETQEEAVEATEEKSYYQEYETEKPDYDNQAASEAAYEEQYSGVNEIEQ